MLASKIAKIINGRFTGRDIGINSLARPEDDAEGKIVFIFGTPKYTGNASCLVIKREIDHPASQIVVSNPKQAFYKMLKKLAKTRPQKEGVKIGKNVSIGASVVIKSGVNIADGVTIGSHAVLGGDLTIGRGSVVGPGSAIMCARIGKKVKIGAGTVVGKEGFGFIKQGGELIRIPHIGDVVIGDQVEIGSNVIIDRASFDSTIIGANTKIDSLVHVGHNVKIGKGCVIIAQSGIAGSSQLGKGVFVAGQAGIKEGVKIGDGSRVLAKAGVFKSFPRKSTVSGIPARDHQKMLKAWAKLFKNK